MKIRSGFVSNSSSSSYLVYIPKDFQLSSEKIQEIWDTEACDKYQDFESFESHIMEAFAKLKSGSIYEADGYNIFGAFEEIIEENNFKIISFDVSSDRGEIQNISEEIIKKIKALP